MIKKLVAIFLFSGIVFAGNLNSHKKIILKKINGEIKIDGIIEEEWSKADSVSDFVQFQPYPNALPTERTVAKILTNEYSFFCLIKCYQPPQEIQLNTGMLDDHTGDGASVFLDTFNDKRTAYKFTVSASGVKSDSRLSEDGRQRDDGWDGIWFAEAKVYNWGYVVEMEIPYKSVRYDDKLNEWGIDFDRFIAQKRELVRWCSFLENEGERISKFGKLLLNGFRPKAHGLNLEIYPVGIAKADYDNGRYVIKSNAGLDVFYNPSPKLTLQFTANPDFAQVEADPYNFNISRYETYFREKRPFFVEGNEVFQAAGKQQHSSFYKPLELFYSRRIGKKLPDGSEVPLITGVKTFGRLGTWEYGGFLAFTGEKEYWYNRERKREPRATFASARIKKQILGNSSVGFLFVGKKDRFNNYGVLDIDGAFRRSDWQLSYQLARSFENSDGDYALSAGFSQAKSSWVTIATLRYVGENFNVEQIGFVPWVGSFNTSLVTGPRWVKKTGIVKDYTLYFGTVVDYTKEDNYADRMFGLGLNIQFRNMAGTSFTVITGRSKDLSVFYNPLTVESSFWYFGHPKIHGNLNLAYSKSYNFRRGYLGTYYSFSSFLEWKPFLFLRLGATVNVYIENKADGSIEDITYNARPSFVVIPFNNISLRVYLDNLFLRSSQKLERAVLGVLFSYNFAPKSWIYFAINDDRERTPEYDSEGNLQPLRLHTIARAAVLKVKYLYYF